MSKKNILSSFVCAALFGFFLFQCGKLSESAALWPRMICLLGLALALLQILLEVIRLAHTPEKSEKLFPLNGTQQKRVGAALLIVLFWVAGLTTVGFLVSSVAALCALAVLFDPDKTKKNLLRDIAVCALFGIVFYFLFSKLGIHFPRTLLM